MSVHFERQVEVPLRARGDAGLAQRALRRDYPLARVDVLRDRDIHWTGLVAGAALRAALGVSRYFQQRKPGPHAQEHGDRTENLAEGAVVLEDEGQHDARAEVQRVARQKPPQAVRRLPFDPVSVADQEPQAAHESRGNDEVNDAKPRQLAQRLSRALLEGQIVQQHPGPAPPAAKCTPNEKRSDDLRHEVMDDHATDQAVQKVEEEAFQLKALAAEDPCPQEDAEADDGQAQLVPPAFAPLRALAWIMKPAAVAKLTRPKNTICPNDPSHAKSPNPTKAKKTNT